VTFQELSNHGAEIYRLAIAAELTGWGFTPDGSHWVPPTIDVDFGGKAPSQIVTEVHVKHGDLMNELDRFAQMPDPEDFDVPIGQMEQVLTELTVGPFVDPAKHAHAGNGSGTAINNISGELRHWHGEAAQAFQTHFMDSLEDKAGAQWTLAWVLLESLRAERAIWQRAQVDIDWVAHNTIQALTGDLPPTPAEKTATKVFGAVTTIASAIKGVGPWVSILQAAGVVAGLGSVIRGDEAVPRSPEAVASILNTMRRSLTTVNEAIWQREHDLQASLSKIIPGVQSGWYEHYALKRPRLADGGDTRDLFGDYY
jgi:hypothetical protein